MSSDQTAVTVPALQQMKTSGQKIVGVQPLNVVPLAHCERVVARRGRALILLRADLYGIRFELLGNGQCLILRAVVNHDDFFVRPGLGNRAAQAISDPAFGVIGWN